MRDTRARREGGERRVELWLPEHVLASIDALTRKRGCSRSEVVAELAVAGLHQASDIAGIFDGAGIEKRVAAVHEAGHALASLRYSLPWDKITILPLLSAEGFMQGPHYDRILWSRDAIRREVFKLMSGEAAQRAQFSADDSLHRNAGSQDRADAHRFLSERKMADESERDAFVDRELKRAIEWFRSPRRAEALHCVVEPLLKKSTLTRAQVIEVLPASLLRG
jgi:ATP-dependent Zn protease